MCYPQHICNQVSLHSVDSRISWAPSSTQMQHWMKHSSTGRMPLQVKVEFEKSFC